MSESRLGSPPPGKVAVVRALRGLGDFMCAVPALRALRSGLPDAEITLIGLPATRPLQQRFSHYLDDFLDFPGFPGIPELELDLDRLTDFLAQVRGRFDLALQMQGSGTHSNAFVAMLGARAIAGHYLPALWCPDPDRFMPYPSHSHEVHRWLALTEFLGLAAQGDSLEFPVHSADRQGLSAVCELERREYVCLHPGASEVERRWPVERFAAVGDALASTGRTVVVTGTASERELTAAVCEQMEHQAVDLAGSTDLGALAALFTDASLVVCNDTGVSHLAFALGTPSVVIFTASDPGRWGPLEQIRHRAIGEAMPERANACRHTPSVKGHRCLRDGCSSLLVAGLETWSPAPVGEVLTACSELLQSQDGH